MAEATGAAALRKLAAAKLALVNAVVAGCEEYANGGNRGEPIVRRHFTAGNEGRYNFPPLSPDYAVWKAGGTTKTTGGGAFLNKKQGAALNQFMAGLQGVKGAARKAARATKVAELRGGRAASKLDKGAAIGGDGKGGVKRGPGLPILVLTGRLRDAIAGKRAIVTIVSPSLVRIVWGGVPTYAKFHQDGTTKMPKRSPIDPNAADIAAILAAARRHLSASLVTGSGAVGGMGDGRARVIR